MRHFTDWIPARAAVAFLLFIVSASSVQAEGLSRVIRQLSGFGGRFYVTQVESGVASVRRVLGREISDQAGYLRFVRGVEAGKLSERELARMSREIRELDREAAPLLSKRDSAMARFLAHERAALSAGLGLESAESMNRLTRFFPAAPLEGSLLSARAELFAAGRYVPDSEAAKVLEAAMKQRVTLESAQAEVDAALKSKKVVFDGKVVVDGTSETLKIELTYRNFGTASRPVWKPDTRFPIRLSSPVWGKGRVVEAHLFSIKPRLVITTPAGLNSAYAASYQELTYVGQLAEAKRPLEFHARIRGEKIRTPEGDEIWDFTGASFEVEAGALTSGR